MKERESLTIRKKKWNDILSLYRLTHIDKFDEEIITGIKQGYFNEAKLLEIAAKNEEIFTKRELANASNEAWKLFHNHLNDNSEKVIDSLFITTKAILSEISGNNFDATIRLLKELGANEQASTLLKEFSKTCHGSKDYWERGGFSNDRILDPDVIAIFDEKAKNFVQKYDHREILTRCSVERGWNPSDTEALAELSTEEMVALIKTFNGDELTRVKDFLLMANTNQNPTNSMRTMTEHAVSALKVIASENDINRIRMKWHHGIEPD